MKNRRLNRMGGYDYSQAGCYFVTIYAQDRQCLFGEIIDDKMVLNGAGKMVKKAWNELPKFYRDVLTDQFQIMPNHVHGVIVITGNEPHQAAVGTGPCACPKKGQPRGVVPTLSLSDIVHRFKSWTTHQYFAGMGKKEWESLGGKLWQRSFHDHIVRDDDDLNRVREYIQNNPLRWALDAENPDNRAAL